MPEKLSPYIKSFRYLKITEKLQAPYVEDILPDGHHEIIFHPDHPSARKAKDADNWQNDPAIFFTGQKTKSYMQRFQPGAVIYGVRFHPHTQAMLYKFPASLATNNLLSLADVEAQETLPSCIEENPQKTFARLEKEFIKKAARIKKPGTTFQYVDAAVQKIMRTKGHCRMGALEKTTGVSSRYLEKSFQYYVGLSPKQLCTIVKYNHFIQYRKDNPGETLAQCAYASDFSDQSHLIRLARQITGSSLKKYFT